MKNLQVLDEVLTRPESHGILAKKSKCEFMVTNIEFLGYRVDGEGRHPTEEKIAAITAAPSPKNVAVLRSYLGLRTNMDTSFLIFPPCFNRYTNCFRKNMAIIFLG